MVLRKKRMTRNRDLYIDVKKGKTYEEFFGIEKAEQIKKKIRDKRKNQVITKETKIKIGLSKVGTIPWNKGKRGGKHTEEHKRNIRLSSPKGKEHYNWNGGSSYKSYGLSWTKQFREDIRKRDNNVCQLCNKHRKELNRALNIHHIDYIKTNIFKFNLISLCNYCHGLTNLNRTHWIHFFRSYLSEKYGYSY